jgi:hypothetical protein
MKQLNTKNVFCRRHNREIVKISPVEKKLIGHVIMAFFYAQNLDRIDLISAKNDRGPLKKRLSSYCFTKMLSPGFRFDKVPNGDNF